MEHFNTFRRTTYTTNGQNIEEKAVSVTLSQLKRCNTGNASIKRLFDGCCHDAHTIYAHAHHDDCLYAANMAYMDERDAVDSKSRSAIHAANESTRHAEKAAHKRYAGNTLSDAADLIQEAMIALWEYGYGNDDVDYDMFNSLHTAFAKLLYLDMANTVSHYAIRKAFKAVRKVIYHANEKNKKRNIDIAVEIPAPCKITDSNGNVNIVDAVQAVHTHTTAAHNVPWVSDIEESADIKLPKRYDISSFEEWEYLNDSKAALCKRLSASDRLYIEHRLKGYSRIESTAYVWGNKSDAARTRAKDAVNRIQKAYVLAMGAPNAATYIEAMKKRTTAAAWVYGNTDARLEGADFERFKAAHSKQDLSGVKPTHITDISMAADSAEHMPISDESNRIKVWMIDGMDTDSLKLLENMCAIRYGGHKVENGAHEAKRIIAAYLALTKEDDRKKWREKYHKAMQTLKHC